MSSSITADHLAFRAAVADVRRAADLVRADRLRVTARVDALLDRGWQGAAAASYAAGWTEWIHAADAVQHGLATMGDLLEAADRDLVRTDAAAGDGLATLRARLG